MVSKLKLYAQLDRMEAELHERIIPHLEDAARGNNDLVFCATAFNPFPELRLRADAETDSLIQLGRQILVLMEKLGETSDGTIAERLCVYCRNWGDTGDSHRQAARKLAAGFLREINGGDS